jgi:4-hydroxyproline epimerase
VPVEIPGFGVVHGDIAWGGNWFFLIEAGALIDVDFANLDALTQFTLSVREALETFGITGEDGGEIDHIEVFSPPAEPALADSKNFVLCPGGAYDRSPCGTGTSAKLACLHADGKLRPGETWRQAGILDTVFAGSIEEASEGGILPTIKGSAFITAESELLIDEADPFGVGIHP